MDTHATPNRLTDGDADRFTDGVASADAPEKLVKLSQTKPLGMFDDDDAGLRNIDPDLDNRRRHQQLCLAATKSLHGVVALGGFHLAMCKRDIDAGKGICQRRVAVLGGGDVNFFRFLHKRTDPVGAPPCCQRGPQPRDNIAKPVQRQCARVDRQPSGGFLVKP